MRSDNLLTILCAPTYFTSRTKEESVMQGKTNLTPSVPNIKGTTLGKKHIVH